MGLARASRTKEEVLKDFRTREIRDAARRVISRAGYAEASMERIAREAGVAKGTLYLYFRGKEELLAATLEDGFAELMEDTRAATERARGGEAKLREAVRAFLEHTHANAALFRALQERPDLRPEGSSPTAHRLRTLLDAYLAYLADVIGGGFRGRQLRAIEPQRAARLLIELLRAAIAERLREGSATDVSKDAETVVSFFLHGVGQGGRK